LLPVTVYTLGAAATVGVPLMVPLVVSNTQPAGSAGLMAQIVTGAPLTVGEIVCAAMFAVKL